MTADPVSLRSSAVAIAIRDRRLITVVRRVEPRERLLALLALVAAVAAIGPVA